jgi:hypothetical protein
MIVTGNNLHQLAGRLNNFTNDWKTRVVGSVEGDAVVPKASQLYMHDTPKIGGRQRFIVRSDAYHGEVQLPVIRRGTPWQAQNRAPEDVAKYLRDLQLP